MNRYFRTKGKYKLRAVALLACICTYSALGGDIYAFDNPSMIADRSNESRPLLQGTSFYAITNDKIIKISGADFKTTPKARIFLDGKETFLDMTKGSDGRSYELTLPDNIAFDTLMRAKNGLQIVGELNKKPYTIPKFSTNPFTTKFISKENQNPGRVIINDNKNFIGNYDYLPLVVTNLNFKTTSPLAIYVEYEKIDDPKYEKDPDVMETGYEPRILYGAPWIKDGGSPTTFYIKTPYGYKTNIYGLKATVDPTETILIDEQGGIITNNPIKYGTFTSTMNVPMLIINPNTGDITIPEFIASDDNNYKAPLPKEVEYFNIDSKEDKENTIKSGINFPENNPNRPIKYEILSPIPEDISDTPVPVKVKLIYKDGSSIILDVPVVVKKSNKPVPPQPSGDNLDPHINLLHDRYTVIFAMQDTLRKRLGDLRADNEDKKERGIWARMKKASYFVNDDSLKFKYTGIQIGYDREKLVDKDTDTERSIYKGFAFEHLTGDADSTKIAAKNELQGNILSLYRTNIYKDGRYLDLVAKLGKVRDHMTVEDETSPDSAIWRSTYYSLSAEYGKLKQKEDYYIEPQVQLTYSHLGSGEYLSENNTKAYVKGVNSLILRGGILFGKKEQQNHFYGKIFANHEFLGNTTGEYTVGTNNYTHTIRNRGTWLTVGLGLQKYIGKQNYLYFDVERDFAKKIHKNWEFNWGIRHMF